MKHQTRTARAFLLQDLELGGESTPSYSELVRGLVVFRNESYRIQPRDNLIQKATDYVKRVSVLPASEEDERLIDAFNKGRRDMSKRKLLKKARRG